ncbi:MAG: Lactose transport system permease protein LacF [Anaerolineae bacterium]|nr:Lactose transport system permease protein LacF [Anaerolineae bacterium]
MQTPNVHKSRSFPWHILVFLAPAVIVYTVFMIIPLIDSLRLSLYAITPDHQEVFNGLNNYVVLLTDPRWSAAFQNAFWNNVKFFIVHMVVQNSIGLLLASLLVAGGRARSVYRTLIFAPTVLSVVIIGFIWNLILSPLWGVGEGILKAVGLGALFAPWLGLASSALTTLSLISVWQFIGIPMLLFYVALLGIPEELMEAARVDGAGGWTAFWRIKFPLILPTVGIVAILTFVGNFNAFDLIYTVKGAQAGPQFATDIMGTFFYRTFFGSQLQLGNPAMGATVAGMMLFIILAGVAVYLFFWQRRIATYDL